MNDEMRTTLEAIGRLSGPNDDGDYRLTVGVANSQRDGEDEYERTSDEAIDAVRQKLPPGWSASWAGIGNTDQNGDCTEDMYIVPGFCFLCGDELDATAIIVDVSEIGESGISHRDCIDDEKARRAEQRNNQRGK